MQNESFEELHGPAEEDDTRPGFIDLTAEEEDRAGQQQEVCTAFTEAPVGMALLDLSGRFLQVNRRCAR